MVWEADNIVNRVILYLDTVESLTKDTMFFIKILVAIDELKFVILGLSFGTLELLLSVVVHICHIENSFK